MHFVTASLCVAYCNHHKPNFISKSLNLPPHSQESVATTFGPGLYRPGLYCGSYKYKSRRRCSVNRYRRNRNNPRNRVELVPIRRSVAKWDPSAMCLKTAETRCEKPPKNTDDNDNNNTSSNSSGTLYALGTTTKPQHAVKVWLCPSQTRSLPSKIYAFSSAAAAGRLGFIVRRRSRLVCARGFFRKDWSSFQYLCCMDEERSHSCVLRGDSTRSDFRGGI